MSRPAPNSTLFPYTTLFRSKAKEQGGYDNNFVVAGKSGTLRLAAELSDPKSGRKMEMWTTEPAVQLYTANWLRSEENTSELQSLAYLVCRLLLEKKKHINHI